ncbi:MULTISPECIES: SEC10/PgrA surface exclusion domain-containing protein, partial [Lactiplantibacillus]
MKKTRITLMSTALIAAGATAIGTATTAQADTTNQASNNATTGQVQTAKTSQAELDGNIKNAQATVKDAKDKTGQAQTAADTAKTAASKSANQAATAQTTATKAQTALSTAKTNEVKAQQVADSATDDAISQAQDAVTNQQDQNQQLTQTVDTAKTDVAKAGDRVTSAQSVVDQTNADATQADQKVADAQAKVDHAQDIVDGKYAAAAQQNLAKAQQNLSQAQTNANQATDATKQTSQAVSDAQTKVATAQTNLDTANQAQNDAQKNVDIAQQAQSNAQQALDSAQSQGQENSNQIHLSQDYIKALRSYNDNQSDANKQALIKAGKAVEESLHYQSNSADQAIKINSFDDFTPEVMQRLSEYAAQLINSMRDEFGDSDWIDGYGQKFTGHGHVNVTAGGIKFAIDIAKQYDIDNWNNENGHDVSAINKAAAENGLISHTKMNMFEDLATSGDVHEGSWNLTLDDFMERVYESLRGFMFNDVEWGHANNILGDTSGGKDQSFGLSFSKSTLTDYEGIPGTTRIIYSHFVFVPQRSDYFEDASKFD